MCVVYIGLSISEGQQTRHETRRQVRNLAVFTVAYCIISLALFLSLSQKGGRRADWLPAVPAMPTRYQTCNQAETDNDDVHFLTRFLCPSSWKKNKKFNLLMSGKGKPEIRLNFVAEWSLYLFLMANSSVYDKNVARQLIAIGSFFWSDSICDILTRTRKRHYQLQPLSFLWFAINFWTWLKAHSRILYFLFFCIGPDDKMTCLDDVFSAFFVIFVLAVFASPSLSILLLADIDRDSRWFWLANVVVYMGLGHESVFSSLRDGEVNFSVPPNFLLEGRTFCCFHFYLCFWLLVFSLSFVRYSS